MNIQFEKTITVNDADPINISAVFNGDYQRLPEKWQLNSIICGKEIDLLPNLTERGKAWITLRTLKDARNVYRKKWQKTCFLKITTKLSAFTTKQHFS